MKIKAILFDLDGTLRDSREVILQAMEHALHTHLGSSPSREEILPHIHYHVAVHKKFAGHIPEDDFVATYADKLNELRDGRMEPYDGIKEVIPELGKLYRLGTVSGASTSEEYLAQYGLDTYFEVFVGGPDTKEHKPHPEPVLLALKKLHLKADEVVMIGDLPADIQAAHAAGLKHVIGVTHGFGSKEELLAAGATKTADNLSEVVDLVALLEAESA